MNFNDKNFFEIDKVGDLANKATENILSIINV
jgi:hypothetical protein